MFDLIIKNANLPDGRTGQDIACKDGKIAAVEANIAAEAKPGLLCHWCLGHSG